MFTNFTQKTPRRSFFKHAAVSTLAVSAATPIATSLLQACTDESLAAPLGAMPQVDSRYTSTDWLSRLNSFFAVKSARNLDQTMGFFSPELVTYTDVTLCWDLHDFNALRKVFSEYMPKWSDSARSYPTRLYGQGNRVVVDFTDSPELFGSELRILSVIDLLDGEIIRWVDYWNGRTFPKPLYNQLRTLTLPTPIQVRHINTQPANTGLAGAFKSGDVDAIVAALATDAIFEDLTLKLTIIGRAEIARFLRQVIHQLPYGSGSVWSYPLPSGGVSGGAEWQASADWPGVQGVMAIGSNGNGAVERLSTIYDGRLCQDAQLTALLTAAIKPNEG